MQLFWGRCPHEPSEYQPVKKEAIQFSGEAMMLRLDFKNLQEDGRINAVERSAEVQEEESCE